MLSLNSIMIGTMQFKTLAAFYEKVIGKPPEMVDKENNFVAGRWATAIGRSGAFRNGREHQRSGAGYAQF